MRRLYNAFDADVGRGRSYSLSTASLQDIGVGGGFKEADMLDSLWVSGNPIFVV